MKIKNVELVAFTSVTALALSLSPSIAGTYPLVDQSFGTKGTVMLKGINGTTGALTKNGDLLVHGYSTGMNPSLVLLKLNSKGKLVNNYGDKGVVLISLGKSSVNAVPEVFSNLLIDEKDSSYGFSAEIGRAHV